MPISTWIDDEQLDVLYHYVLRISESVNKMLILVIVLAPQCVGIDCTYTSDTFRRRHTSLVKTCRRIPSSALTKSEFQRVDICIRVFKRLVDMTEVRECTEDWIIAVEGVIRSPKSNATTNAGVVDETVTSLLDRWTQRTDDDVSLSHQ